MVARTLEGMDSRACVFVEHSARSCTRPTTLLDLQGIPDYCPRRLKTSVYSRCLRMIARLNNSHGSAYRRP